MIGYRFGRLVVLSSADGVLEVHGYTSKAWEVLCDCGVIKTVRESSLRKGNTKSCGCLQKETTTQLMWKHGNSSHPLFAVYIAMISRCHNPKDAGYKNYGEIGITVCGRWLGGFEYFYEDMGECPLGYSIDRINVLEGYSPENCRWADRSLQNFNKRVSLKSKSGYAGVTWHKAAQKWEVSIKKDGKKYHLGLFNSLSDAISVRRTAEINLFGEYSNKDQKE